MKILVAIVSCHRDRPHHQAQRDTWLQDVRGEAEYRFFFGYPYQNPNSDEVFINVDDSYQRLPEKTRAICQWAKDRNYDCIFKCDVDTLVNPRIATYNGEDYMGGENEDNSPYGRIQFASGGAGYWLSRKSMTIIAESDNPLTTAEDVFVAAALLEQGIKPVFHPGYKWRPGTDVDKETVSLHLSSAYQKKYKPEMMLESYAKLKRIQ